MSTTSTSHTLPAEVKVIELPRGVHYRLPLRPLGPWRLVGIAATMLAAILASLPLFCVYRVIHATVLHGDAGTAMFWFFAGIPALLGLKGGIVLGKLGVLILAGHSEIELQNGMLGSIERWGPIRWT